MRKTHLCFGFVAAGAIALALTATAEESRAPAEAVDGAALYNRFCLACHGVYGDGKGPAALWLWPRPRDFTRGEYKWRSTPSGAPPTAEDLAATIRYGAAGTSMHGFGQTLGEAEIDALGRHLADFAPEVFARPAEAVTVPEPPAITPALVERGRNAFSALGCAACHGAAGDGTGPAAANLVNADGLANPPYDLTREPLRRPAARPGVRDIYKSLVTGLSGTPMPAYQGTDDADLWAVAAYVDAIRARAELAGERNAPVIAAQAIAADRRDKLVTNGWYPGHGTPDEMIVMGRTIPFQGQPPASLAPAQASLDAMQCARCHNKQVREWRGALHSHTGSPGLIGQVERTLRAAERKGRDQGASAESCQRCHTPLAEAQTVVRPGHLGGDDAARTYERNAALDTGLRAQGVNCASCHVRGYTRYGPPRVPGSRLLSLAGYPLVELDLYERSDFCLPCHQLAPRNAYKGRPFLDTYREWLEGPYMRRGVQCQHCHMPNREHTWKGVHDPDTFRQGIDLDAIAGRSQKTGAVSVRARLTNVGAGHYLPTTPTPAVWLKIDLVDADGRAIAGAHAEKRIGRHIEYTTKFIEHEDTRIPPGESVELAAAWKNGRVGEATHAKITVYVKPDEYYERLYRQRLAGKLDRDIRAMFEQALRVTESTAFVAEERLVPVR